MTEFHVTRRERDILVAAAQGATIDETAHQLGISPQTVKNHRAAIIRKAEAGSLLDAFRVLGWLRVPKRAPATQPWHCVHGLDLRLHERCYLCHPVPIGGFATGGNFVIGPYLPPCTCPTGNYTGDVFCARHAATRTTTTYTSPESVA